MSQDKKKFDAEALGLPITEEKVWILIENCNGECVGENELNMIEFIPHAVNNHFEGLAIIEELLERVANYEKVINHICETYSLEATVLNKDKLDKAKAFIERSNGEIL